MSEELLQQMLDYKEIIELKARFGRLADAKDWEGFKNVFTPDATFDLGNGQLMHGGETYAELRTKMIYLAAHVMGACVRAVTVDDP